MDIFSQKVSDIFSIIHALQKYCDTLFSMEKISHTQWPTVHVTRGNWTTSLTYQQNRMMKLSPNLPCLSRLLCAFAWGLIKDTLCIKINGLLIKSLEFNVV
jgi:hypothetical protein